MRPALHIFRDPPLDGPTNMARDEHLLYSPVLRPAALRIYQWSPPTLSLGYFQRHEDLAALPAEVRGLAVVRRTTGGGAILHDRELTYCLVVDDSLPIGRQGPVALYRLVHESWRTAVSLGGPACALASDEFPLPTPRTGPFFCFEKPGRTDLMIDGEKVLGSAQRRIPGRVLQHGSLILGRRFTAHPGSHLGDPAVDMVERWVVRFVERLCAALELSPQLTEWTEEQQADIEMRRPKFADAEWTRRR